MIDPIGELYDIAEVLQGAAEQGEPMRGWAYIMRVLHERLLEAARQLEADEDCALRPVLMKRTVNSDLS